jgi:SAM-dependent methyltransferase
MQDDPEASPPDLLATSRESLVRAHIIHDFRLARVLDNLAGCYGTLIRDVYREMLSFVKGRRIIDCGCGFGQFSRVAIDAGFEVTSVEIDDVSLALARDISRIPCRKESVYATSLPDGSCDTAVCCDSIQHFDIRAFVPELKRLGVQRIVIYDSNISNPLLTAYRLMAGHKESNDRTVDAIVRDFREHGYDVVALRYENVIALPISGGFQRPPVPLLHRFPSAIQSIDRLLAQTARVLRLDRRLTFRFLIVLDRRETPVPLAGT